VGAADLLELQRLDDRLDTLSAEISALEARLLGSPELTAARRRHRSATAAREAADVLLQARERESTELRERARTLDRQLYGGSVRNPQELLTLQRELEDVRSRLAAREDAELAAMEGAESAAAEVQQAQALLADVDAGRAAAAGPDRDHLAALRSELSETHRQREAAAARRPSAELELYRRVGAHHRPAVVRVAGDSCGGCRLPLGLAEVRAVRARENILQCSNCDRILAP
jgi:predicted  nucleic acid-binding Zn-ribbon protein